MSSYSSHPGPPTRGGGGGGGGGRPSPPPSASARRSPPGASPHGSPSRSQDQAHGEIPLRERMNMSSGGWADLPTGSWGEEEQDDRRPHRGSHGSRRGGDEHDGEYDGDDDDDDGGMLADEFIGGGGGGSSVVVVGGAAPSSSHVAATSSSSYPSRVVLDEGVSPELADAADSSSVTSGGSSSRRLRSSPHQSSANVAGAGGARGSGGAEFRASTLLPGKRISAGTIEQARRFLWDDDDAYVSQDLGPVPSFATTIPGGAGGSGLGLAGAGIGSGTSQGWATVYPWTSTTTDGAPYGGVGHRAPPSYGSSSYTKDRLAGDIMRFPRPHEIENSSRSNGIFRSVGKALAKAASKIGLPAVGALTTKTKKTAPYSGTASGPGMGGGGGKDGSVRKNLAPRRSSLDMRPADHRALASKAFAPPGNRRWPWDGCSDRASACASSVGYFCSSKRRALSIAAAFWVVVVVACVVAYKAFPGAFGGGGGGDRGATSSAALSEDEVRFQDMRFNVITHNLTKPSAFEDVDSVQSKALRWLAAADGSRIDAQDEFLLQRYALAVLYYSAGMSPSRFEGPEGVGERVTFSDSTSQGNRGTMSILQGEDESIPDDDNGGDDTWLSRRGYCSWKGVQCHHKPGTDIHQTTYDGNDGVTHLNLTSDGLFGTIPSELSALTDLRVLDLGENGLSGTVPTELGRLTELVTLGLANNDLTGELPAELGNLVQCTHFLLDRNIIEGTVPTQYGNMVSMHVLSLYENYLSGSFPLVQNMSELRALYIDDNDFTGSLPGPVIGSVTSMEDMRLGTNNFTGPIPTELGNLKRVSKLFLEYNELTGTIPSELGNMTMLSDLHLHQNHLVGPIPKEIGKLGELEVLYLDHNDLSSVIPPDIGQCKNLEELFLQSNKLNGTIPPEILNLESSLVSLHVDSNDLVGRIPEEIDRLSGLEHLYLSNNKLTGIVPDGLADISSLRNVWLQDNELVGAIPKRVCSLRNDGGGILMVLQADCEGDEPKMVCDCCTGCF